MGSFSQPEQQPPKSSLLAKWWMHKTWSTVRVRKELGEFGKVFSEAALLQVLKFDDPRMKVLQLKGALRKIRKASPGNFDMTLEALKTDTLGTLFVKYAAKFVKIAELAEGWTPTIFKSLTDKERAKLFEQDPGRMLALVEKAKGMGDALKNVTAFHSEKEKQLLQEYNILHPARYPKGVLEDMLSGKRDKSRPLAVVAYPWADYTGGFYDNHIQDLSKAGYQVVVFESGSDSKFFEMMYEVRRRWGPASLLLIGGHGDQTSVQLGEDMSEDAARLNITDRRIIAAIKHLMVDRSQRPQIIFEACSTGVVEGKSIAREISDVADAHVFAPNKSTVIARLVFTYPDKNKPKFPHIQRAAYLGWFAGDDPEVQYFDGKVIKKPSP